VNATASPNNLLGSDSRTFDGNLTLALEATKVAAGEIFTVDFRANEFKNIAGYQFTLGFDQSAVEFVEVKSNLAGLNTKNFGLTKLDEGVITTSWNSNESVTVANNEVIFSITFTANTAVNTEELLTINSRYTASEAYSNADLYNVVLGFNGNTVSNGFELFQNTPNPFKAETMIGFNMPKAGAVTLTIYDISGRVLRLIEMDAVEGANAVNVTRDGIDATGVLYYQLETATEIATKKMILVD
jgi:flagellar hook assembly protein FlgD